MKTKKKRKTLVDKPYCSEHLTEAGFRAFIINRLRGSHWRPKYDAILARPHKQAVNKKTGRMCRQVICEASQDYLPQKELQADHIQPMVPIEGWGDSTRFLGYNWNELLPRLFVEKEGYQIISKEIHKQKSKEENKQRKNR